MADYGDFTKHLRERDDDSKWDSPPAMRRAGFDKHIYSRYPRRSLLRKREDGADFLMAHKTDGIDGDIRHTRWLLGRYSTSSDAYVQIAPRHDTYGMKGSDFTEAMNVLRKFDLAGRRTFGSLIEAKFALKDEFRTKLGEFAKQSGMSAEWFCRFVGRQIEQRFTASMIADQINHGERSISFDERNVETLRSELARMLFEVEPKWLETEPAAPAVPPRDPNEQELAWIRQETERVQRDAEAKACQEEKRAREAEQLRQELERKKEERAEAIRVMWEEMREFRAKAGMAAPWFCQYVSHQRSQGVPFADIAAALDDPQRGIKFTAESVETHFNDFVGKLSKIDPGWSYAGYDEPEIPRRNHAAPELDMGSDPEPDYFIPEDRSAKAPTAGQPAMAVQEEPTKPVEEPTSFLKFASNFLSRVAGRITDHKTRAGEIAPEAERDHDDDTGFRPR